MKTLLAESSNPLHSDNQTSLTAAPARISETGREAPPQGTYGAQVTMVAGNRNQLNLLKNKIRPCEVADAAELVQQLKLMVWERDQRGLLLCAAA